jgi:hypothetical protein
MEQGLQRRLLLTVARVNTAETDLHGLGIDANPERYRMSREYRSRYSPKKGHMSVTFRSCGTVLSGICK